MKRVGDIQLEEDLAFERRSCRWQRAGQGLLLLFVLAAVAGFFGHGPIASAEVADPSRALTVEYARFARRHGPCEFTLELGPALRRGAVEVWLDASFAEQYRWESATPEPTAMEMRDGRLVARFQIAPGESPARIVVHVQPRKLGRAATLVGVVGGPQVALRAFHFP